MTSVRQIYSAFQIQERIAELAHEISHDYQALDHIVVIGVMKGAFCFLADLVRKIDHKDSLQIEFVRLASYGDRTESTGHIETPYLELPNISFRNILVVEDIIDSGRTAKFFLEYLKDQFQPATLKMVTFLDRPSRRVVPIKSDYVGFTIQDRFVVGYGLDYGEDYRELPYLGELIDNG